MASVSIIVAVSKTFGIGKDGAIPWKIPEDLSFFYKTTKDSAVVMGRKTYESIPNMPLKNRMNIVVTKTPEKYTNSDTMIFVSDPTEIIKNAKNVFIIGGACLYEQFVGVADRIYLTLIEKDYECDTFFPTKELHKYKLDSVSERKVYGDIGFRHLVLVKTDRVHDEFAYLDMLKEIMGKCNRDDRTGVGTKSVFARQLRFDISDSIPILTTKFISWKTVLKELLWFIQGKTDSKLLEKQGVNIWAGNTTREFLDDRGLDYEVGDIGPMYGFNWRHFGAEYTGCCEDYAGKGYDQLVRLIEDIKKDPNSRRHMMTTYDPRVIDKSVLAPCHGIVIQFYVDNGKLSCCVYCRSSDSFLGLPFNITSYAILTSIIAKLCGLQPQELIVNTGDTHIYLNHLKQVELQLTRDVLPFPKLIVSDGILTKNLNDIAVDDFDVVGYVYWPTIKGAMAK